MYFLIFFPFQFDSFSYGTQIKPLINVLKLCIIFFPSSFSLDLENVENVLSSAVGLLCIHIPGISIKI